MEGNLIIIYICWRETHEDTDDNRTVNLTGLTYYSSR